MRRSLWLIMIVVLFARPALAQKQVALELYREGVALTQRGEYRQAIQAFERSLAAYPHQNTLYALGEAHRRLGQLRQSFKFYSRYADWLEGKAREDFLVKLRQLREQALSTLTVTTDPAGAAVWIDGRLSGSTSSPLRVELRAGTHRVRAVLAGQEEVQGKLKAEFGEPINLHLRMARRPEPRAAPAPVGAIQPRPAARARGWFVAASVGPSVSGYGDSSLSIGASVDAALELGHLWQRGRLGLLVGLIAEVAPVTDTIADDRAAFVNLLPGVGGRVFLGAGFWLEVRFGFGLAVLADAAPESFLVRGRGGAGGTYLGLALQPALEIGWTFWRGLGLVLMPGALDYSPRIGGFGDLGPNIGPILRYHASLGLSWTFGRAGGQ